MTIEEEKRELRRAIAEALAVPHQKLSQVIKECLDRHCEKFGTLSRFPISASVTEVNGEHVIDVEFVDKPST